MTLSEHPLRLRDKASFDAGFAAGIGFAIQTDNGPLFAAAPELLEALKSLDRLVVELYPGHVEPDGEHLGEYQAVWAAVHNARAAIAKATGGAA